MRLLANNDIGALHAELELLPDPVRATAPVKFAMELERLMLEGNYHRVRVAAASAPDPSFQFFVRLLVPTMRREVAACATAAYDTIAKAALGKMLMFDAPADLDAFIAAQPNWRVVGDRVHLEREQTASKDVTAVAAKLIEQHVGYARQVERIV
jgi:26S proteasome regulatory subunit N12